MSHNIGFHFFETFLNILLFQPLKIKFNFSLISGTKCGWCKSIYNSEIKTIPSI